MQRADSKLDYLHFYLLNYSSRALYEIPNTLFGQLDNGLLSYYQFTKVNANNPLATLIMFLRNKYILMSIDESQSDWR